MRSFAFAVFDIDNSILDRFPLDVVTDLSGLGWRLKLSTLEGDVTDTITKVVQERQSVGLTINLIGRGYEKFTIYRSGCKSIPRRMSRLHLNTTTECMYDISRGR